MKLIENYRLSLIKALAHLEYSYNKIQCLPVDPASLDEEILETWESFTARFARVVDIFLTKYVKAYVLADDPGFTGSLRDFVDQAEKLRLLSNADKWMELRGFRNSIAHEYQEEELTIFLKSIRECSPFVMSIKGILNAP